MCEYIFTRAVYGFVGVHSRQRSAIPTVPRAVVGRKTEPGGVRDCSEWPDKPWEIETTSLHSRNV